VRAGEPGGRRPVAPVADAQAVEPMARAETSNQGARMVSEDPTRRCGVWFRTIPMSIPMSIPTSLAPSTATRVPARGLGIALLACAKLALFSTPAFADNASNGPSSMPVPAASGQHGSPAGTASPRRARTGWLVLGIGGAVTVTGIVIDIVGASQGTVAGSGGGSETGNTSNARTNFFWGGTALIIAGVVTGVVGGAMIVNSTGSTRSPEDPMSGDAATKAVQAASKSAPAFAVPVLSATF
jgi:hypothetical protein